MKNNAGSIDLLFSRLVKFLAIEEMDLNTACVVLRKKNKEKKLRKWKTLVIKTASFPASLNLCVVAVGICSLNRKYKDMYENEILGK